MQYVFASTGVPVLGPWVREKIRKIKKCHAPMPYFREYDLSILNL